MLPVGGWSVFPGAGGRMVANQGDGVRVRVARHPGVSRSAPVASRVPDDRCWRTIHRDWVLRHGDACGRDVLDHHPIADHGLGGRAS